MSGRLQEICLSELKERQQSAQSEINDFIEEQTTFVAVVSCPRGGIERYADEVWPELGMPERQLKKFLARRDGYRTNSAVDNPHEKAYEDTNLRQVYHDYLERSTKAGEKIAEATERLVSGENITLVCYESSDKSCHRHILIDMIRTRVESRENCQFTLRA